MINEKVSYQMKCDCCQVVSAPSFTWNQFTDMRSKEGWVIAPERRRVNGDDGHYCPDCAKANRELIFTRPASP